MAFNPSGEDFSINCIHKSGYIAQTGALNFFSILAANVLKRLSQIEVPTNQVKPRCWFNRIMNLFRSNRKQF